MLLKNTQLSQDETRRKLRSTMQWGTSLFAGGWDKFISKTDKDYTKSSKLASRLEMVKNAINFGFPTLALKLFKEKYTFVDGPVIITSNQLINLAKTQDLISLHEEDQFLKKAFGSPAEVLDEEKIMNKGEHYFYLANSNAEEEDIKDFIENRLKNEKTSMNDIANLLQILQWYPNSDVDDAVLKAWFDYMKRDNSSKEKVLHSFSALKEKINETPDIKSILDDASSEELDKFFADIRLTIDNFSYAIPHGKPSYRYMNYVENYVYLHATDPNARVKVYEPKKKFENEENIYDKKKILNALYHGLTSEILLNLNHTCPI